MKNLAFNIYYFYEYKTINNIFKTNLILQLEIFYFFIIIYEFILSFFLKCILVNFMKKYK